MVIYFAFIFSIAMLSTLAAILDLISFYNGSALSSETVKRIDITARACNMGITINFLFLHFLMLMLYYKFSKLKSMSLSRNDSTMDRVADQMNVEVEE